MTELPIASPPPRKKLLIGIAGAAIVAAVGLVVSFSRRNMASIRLVPVRPWG